MARQPWWALASSMLLRFRDHTRTHTTLSSTSLDEGSARPKDFYLTTNNTHTRQTSMPPAGLKPAIPANEEPQTHDFDRAAIGIGYQTFAIN